MPCGRTGEVSPAPAFRYDRRADGGERMKVYISVDIEGTAGITHWDEARKAHADYAEFREEMTREAVSACEGAIAAGTREIVLKDAHGSGRNIIAARLPECARIVRGWSGHPLSMVQELDATFDAVLFIGYHSKAGAETNPLAHTLSTGVARIKLNGTAASEFLLHAYAAATFDVPAVFVSGDQALCEDVAALNPHIRTLAVTQGIGPSTVSMVPTLANRLIREGATAALKGDRGAARLRLPEAFVLEVTFVGPTQAYKASWYPGARHIGEQTVRLETKEYFEVLRALQFIL
jgi:D-amino peptidase